jgi:toxin-antitoxin system PIN domain toxin
VIIPDANLILYAYNSADPDHKAARLWWEGLLANDTPIGISIVVLLAFLRLSTSARVLQKPLTVEESTERVRSWFTVPSLHLIQPGRNHVNILLDLIRRGGSGGNLTSDAHLAALAIEHNAEIHSSDQDFGRYPGLRWRNPLKARAGTR